MMTMVEGVTIDEWESYKEFAKALLFKQQSLVLVSCFLYDCTFVLCSIY